MNFKVITLFPEMFEVLKSGGLISQAIEKEILKIETVNPRDFSSDKHLRIDDKPFGGVDGMLCRAEDMQKPLEFALINNPNARKIYLSARGAKLSDSKLREISKSKQDLILICGRYAGIDQRFIYQNQIEELSIGDYILTGGELPAMVFIDALARFLPLVLGNPCSPEKDSFCDGRLEAPQFTRPQNWRGLEVPKVLTSGDHKKVQEWQETVSLLVTLDRRPDLVDLKKINDFEANRSMKFIQDHSKEELAQLGIINIEEIIQRLSDNKK